MKHKFCSRCKTSYELTSKYFIINPRTKRPYSYCRTCASKNTAIYRAKNKDKMIEYKGGKCCICGYKKCKKALEFHHLNSKEKDKQLNKFSLQKNALAKILKELDKCVLLCANCHREFHDGLILLA